MLEKEFTAYLLLPDCHLIFLALIFSYDNCCYETRKSWTCLGNSCEVWPGAGSSIDKI